MKILLPLLICCLCSLTAFAQQAGKLKKKHVADLQAAEQSLADLALTMHTDSSERRRFDACKQLIVGLVEALKTPNSYHYAFDKVDGIAVRTAPDNSFRTITWEYHVNRDEYRHYGAIQWNSKKLKLRPLLDRSSEWRGNPENKVTGADNWLGYVVYDILPGGELNGKPYYFLFGFDRKSGFVRRKVLDVLTFDAYDNVQFGLPVFQTYTPEGLLLVERARIILDYGAEATVVLNHEPATGRIVYENLVIVPGPDDAAPLQMPDGSYRALEYREDGLWHEAEKVFTHKYDAAPVDDSRANKEDDIMWRLRRTTTKPDGGRH